MTLAAVAAAAAVRVVGMERCRLQCAAQTGQVDCLPLVVAVLFHNHRSVNRCKY